MSEVAAYMVIVSVLFISARSSCKEYIDQCIFTVESLRSETLKDEDYFYCIYLFSVSHKCTNKQSYLDGVRYFFATTDCS